MIYNLNELTDTLQKLESSYKNKELLNFIGVTDDDFDIQRLECNCEHCNSIIRYEQVCKNLYQRLIDKLKNLLIENTRSESSVETLIIKSLSIIERIDIYAVCQPKSYDSREKYLYYYDIIKMMCDSMQSLINSTTIDEDMVKNATLIQDYSIYINDPIKLCEIAEQVLSHLPNRFTFNASSFIRIYVDLYKEIFEDVPYISIRDILRRLLNPYNNTILNKRQLSQRQVFDLDPILLRYFCIDHGGLFNSSTVDNITGILKDMDLTDSFILRLDSKGILVDDFQDNEYKPFTLDQETIDNIRSLYIDPPFNKQHQRLIFKQNGMLSPLMNIKTESGKKQLRLLSLSYINVKK